VAVDQVVHLVESLVRNPREPLAPETSRVSGAVLGKCVPRRAQRRLVLLRALLDLAQPQHVRERPSGCDEIGLRRRAKLPRTHGERLARQCDRLQIVLERGTLATLARRLGQDDALPQDQVALRLLHTP